MAFYKSRRTFVEFKDSVMTNFEDGIGRFDDRDVRLGFTTWSNSSLYPENSQISAHSTVMDCLQYAKKRDTLHRIHDYSRSLAFTVTVKVSIWGGECKFRCYDLSTISLQAAANDLIEAADEDLFQATNRYALASSGPGLSNLIPNADPQVLANLEIILRNLGEVLYNIPIWNDGRFTYEVWHHRNKDWLRHDWTSQMKRMREIFNRSAGQ